MIGITKNIENHIKKCKCGNEALGINKVHMCGSFGCEVWYWIECPKCKRCTERFDNPVAAVTDWNAGNVMHWKDRTIKELFAALMCRD